MIEFLTFSSDRRMVSRGNPKNSKPLLRLWLLVFCLWVCGLPAKAQDHIVGKAWLEDLSGAIGWQEAQKQTLHPYAGVLSLGFGSAPIWIRLRIDPLAHPLSTREPDKLILRIRPVYLDEIEVYDPLATQGLAGTTGDRHHPRNHAFEGLDFMLPIALGDAPRDIWLKVRSTSTRQIAVEAVNVDSLTRLMHKQELIYALYIGVIIVFVIWALVYWLFSQEHLVGAFALSQLAALFYAFCSLGYARAFWPLWLSADALDLLTSVFSVLAVSSAVLFHVLHIREFSPPRWISWLFFALLGLAPVKLFLLGMQLSRLALNLNMLEILVAPTLFVVATFLAKGWDRAASSQQPAARFAQALRHWFLCTALGHFADRCAARPGAGGRWRNTSVHRAGAWPGHRLPDPADASIPGSCSACPAKRGRACP